ncbi:hypothetical protein [Streptosporangium subroseum]|uniref:hypothetical protein n=1 Tax=Streptosporangium subroseum TaxID=106412 RepID=UPI0015C69588|nr:hypothetical protein [Streptosporangium subroseum]
METPLFVGQSDEFLRRMRHQVAGKAGEHLMLGQHVVRTAARVEDAPSAHLRLPAVDHRPVPYRRQRPRGRKLLRKPSWHVIPFILETVTEQALTGQIR